VRVLLDLIHDKEKHESEYENFDEFLNILAPPRLDVGPEDFSMVLVGLVE